MWNQLIQTNILPLVCSRATLTYLASLWTATRQSLPATAGSLWTVMISRTSSKMSLLVPIRVSRDLIQRFDSVRGYIALHITHSLTLFERIDELLVVSILMHWCLI